MAENQEQIESRLCGYVDQTLDPAEKDEIEAHLEAHPQHRQLLAELRRMRADLQGLPRESAPAEMSESFTGQLERSVLLDGIAQQSAEPRMRISRMPQLAAIAAIVLLALGLGYVIYYASLTGAKPTVAQNTRTPVMPDNDAAAPIVARSSVPSAVSADRMDLAKVMPPTAHGVMPAPPIPGAAGSVDENADLAAMPDASPQIVAIADSALSNNTVRLLLGRGVQMQQVQARSGRPTLVMVVPTADPDATKRKMSDYLETNNADWQPATSVGAMEKASPAPLAVAHSGNGVGGFSAESSMPTTAAAGALEPAQTAMAATEPQTLPDAFANAGAAANVPATNPFTIRQPSQIAMNLDEDKVRESKSLKDIESEQFSDENSRLYVVHNVSFQQARALSGVLGQNGAPAAAPLFADKGVDGAGTVGSSAQAKPAQQQMLRPADDVSAAATRPTTLPESGIRDDRQLTRAQIAQTNPAVAVGPVDQSLLGSSPVDLVIVIQPAAAAPMTQPAILPTTAPSTAPASQP